MTPIRLKGMKTKKLWKVFKADLASNNGDIKWKIGEWKKQPGKLSLCNNGFHCSKKIYQAFSYIQGEILAEVEVRGDSVSDQDKDDKEAWSEMRIVKAWKWQKKDSVALSIFAAELCLKNYEEKYPDDKRPREAIEAAKKWLETGSKKGLSAAESAARSAAESAAA